MNGTVAASLRDTVCLPLRPTLAQFGGMGVSHCASAQANSTKSCTWKYLLCSCGKLLSMISCRCCGVGFQPSPARPTSSRLNSAALINLSLLASWSSAAAVVVASHSGVGVSPRRWQKLNMAGNSSCRTAGIGKQNVLTEVQQHSWSPVCCCSTPCCGIQHGDFQRHASALATKCSGRRQIRRSI